MKAQTAPGANREIMVTIELDEDTVNAALRKVADTLAPRVAIPGFRRSRVPYRVLERYVGRAAMLSEAHEELGQSAIQTYLQEADLGEVESLTLERIEDQPVIYTFRIALEPYAELGDYRELRIEVQELELTAEDRAREKSALLQQRAELAKVESPADWGDHVTLDIRSVILDEAQEPTEEVVLEDEAWQVMLDREHALTPPGLEQELLGQAPGTHKEFVLAYPEDSDSVHAGRSAHFTITVQSVERMQEAEWNADLLAQVLDEGEATRTLAEYEEIFWRRMHDGKANQVFQAELEEAFALLESVSVLEFPAVSVEQQIDLLVNQRMHGLEQFGIRNLETYLRYTRQTQEEYRASLKPQAVANLKQNLLIWAFIEQEGIVISDEMEAQLIEDAQSQVKAVMQTEEAARNKDLSEKRLYENVLQHSLSEALRQLGRNALLELVTDGQHSITDYARASTVQGTDDAAAEEDAEAEPDTGDGDGADMTAQHS